MAFRPLRLLHSMIRFGSQIFNRHKQLYQQGHFILYSLIMLTLQCLVVTKSLHMLKQTCSFQQQVCLSMPDLFATTRH